MKLNNNNKIIYEDDIIMSDGKNSLSDIMTSHENKISKLESNLKWIYKYGGIGSSGGSGGNSQTFSIFASLNGILLKDQSIVLKDTGVYPLNIKINNPLGAAFNVKYSYSIKSEIGNDIKLELTVILSIENNYEFTTNINLNTNSTLQITVSDGNETKQVMCNYITTPYMFELSLVDDNGNSVPSEHFIENAAKDGVNVKLTYIVSIPATINYKYTFEDLTINGEIVDKNNSILFKINKELFKPEKAGFYTANLDLLVVPDGLELVKINRYISFSLIPDGLYMLILPETGIIYDTTTPDGFQYSPGYLAFNYRIYEGVSLNRTYNVTIILNGHKYLELSVEERLQYTFKIFTVKAGENTIEIQVTRSTTYKKSYYFYIQDSLSELTWFQEDLLNLWTLYYYRINEVSDIFSLYKNQSYIELTVNSPAINITGIKPPNVSSDGLLNTHVAIGLLFNTINDEDPDIVSFYYTNSGSSPVLTIKQSQVTRSNYISELYIKKLDNCNKDTVNNYHLILIYSQYIKSIENNHYYEVSLYIDGILENVFGQLISSPLLINSLQIKSTNCYINLLDVDFKTIDKSTELKNPTNCDVEVYLFFLKYKNTILRLDIGEELSLLPDIKNFKVGLNGRVTSNLASINNIAKNNTTPVMIMTYDDKGEAFNKLGGFMSALEASYGEDGTLTGGDMNFLVSLGWSPGRNDIQEITPPSEFPNHRFIVELQGSSTKAYRVKNFTLRLENTTGTEQDETYLYSPNFSHENASTFLPETEFTLKADIVDSSHSNNTSCGRFINTVCKKFSDYMSENSYYNKYIKNCLDGFPFLLFLHHKWTNKVTMEEYNDYYYLGVYNFNLGRSSYYNLGYKDLSVFGDSSNKLLNNAGNSFSFFKIPPSKDILKEGLGIAEILGGDPHFDFSLWDSSVLFLLSDTDQRYMFGDLVRGSNSTEQLLQSAISNFVLKVAKSGGYIFDFLKKTKGPYETNDLVNEGAGYNAEVYDELGQPTGESKNQVPNYSKLYEKFLSPSGHWEFREKKGPDVTGSLQDLRNLIIPDINLNKQASLNFLAVSEYYTICMVLGLVDSVMKNLNIKSWNINPITGEGTWFPAFYDMDTCLGINNQGNPISYFAFSDYWDSLINKTVNGVEYPSAARIYRDFSPHSLGENGYDVPTNYLFTIAKYAKIIYPDNDPTLSVLDKFPQELYANWRNNTENPVTNSGILKNADLFMQRFFANNLATICPALVSYNYRSKYLKIANDIDTSWVDIDFNKFNGTRINKVRDWLNGRLHILDVYFGLNKSITLPITYRTSKGTWETLYSGTAPVTEITYKGNYNLAGNEDVVILKDIFTAGKNDGIQLAGHISFLIRCPEYSPLQIYNANLSVYNNFILGGENKLLVEFTATGTQGFHFGGSLAWTYLQNINWISTGSLYITSDKLQNIMGNSGKFTSLSLHTPNVKTIELTSRLYSGALTLVGITNFPNLSSINLSGSQISLKADSLNIKDINLSNMDAPNAEVSIKNCKALTSLNTTNTKLLSLQIDNIKGELFTIEEDSKNFKLENTNINQITVLGGEKGGTFVLKNDNTVTLVTVGGFKIVKIRDCPKLERVLITLSDILNVENLQVKNCGGRRIAISSEDTYQEGKVTIKNSKINKVYFSQTSGITDAELPNNVWLYPGAFEECNLLKTVTGSNISISAYSFYRCPNYAMKDKDGKRTNLIVGSGCADLLYAFSGTAITWEDVKAVIDEMIPISNSLINVSWMFSNCHNIKFGLKELQDSYTNDDYPNFGKLKKVLYANNIFYSSSEYGQICAINKKFMQMGDSAGCNYDNAVNSYEAYRHLYIPIDIFKGTITKIKELPFSLWNGDCNRIIFTDEVGNPLPTSLDIKLASIFNPDGIAPSKLVGFRNIQPYGDYTFDLTNLFTNGWKKLEAIALVLPYKCKYKGYDNLLLNVPNPVRIYESFNESAIEDATADYYKMFNWELLCKLYKLFIVDDNRQEGTRINRCKKYISADNYRLLCNKILQSKTLTIIDAAFRNVTVIGALGEWKFGDIVNYKIVLARLAFAGFKNKTSLGSSDNYLKFSPNFCLTLPNLADVMGMFLACKMGNPIPFNLFKKRKLEEDADVYVLKEGLYIKATLHKYTYTLDMYNMSHLFEQCLWDLNCLQYDPNKYEIPKNTVVAEGKHYQTYYRKEIIPDTEVPDSSTIIYNKFNVILPTEITDAENLKGGYVGNIGNTITNPTLIGEPNRLIIPPDLFYGLNPQIQSTWSQGVHMALSCSTPLNGIIPANLFKNHKAVRCTYLWYNLIIIPRLVSTWKDENGKTTYNVYVHFPQGYTQYSNLSGAFNSKYIVLEDSTINDSKTINYSFVLLEDSIPKTTSSLEYSFNSDLNWTGFGLLLTTNNHLFNFFGKLLHNNVVHGLNPSHFTNLNLNHIFYSPYILVVNGNLFEITFDAAYMKLYNTSDTLLYTNIIAGFLRDTIASTMILPKASYNIKLLAGPGLHIKANQIVESDTSKSWYKLAGWEIKE